MLRRDTMVTSCQAAKRRPQRQSLRLRGYDYTQCGAYFVTFCAWERRSLFGEILDGQLRLNALGSVVEEAWFVLPTHFPSVELDASVVMPNHMHGVVIIGVAAQHAAPSRPSPAKFAVTPGSLGANVRSFKSAVTRRANELRMPFGAQLWQRNYYEHVIRNDESLDRIRQYITTNPARWELDAENPRRCGQDEFDQWLAAFKARPEVRVNA
jgi:putative transposase